MTDGNDDKNKQPAATTDGGEGSSTPKKTDADKSLQILAEAADVDALANKIANKNKKTTEDGTPPTQGGSPSVDDDDDASDVKEDSNASKSVADDNKEEEDVAKSDDKPGGDNEVGHDTAAVESGKEEKNDKPITSSSRPTTPTTTDAATKEEGVEDTQEKKKTEEESQPLPNERFFPKRPKRRQSGSSSFDDSSSLVIDPNEYKQKFCIPKITKKKRSEEEYKAMELILKQGVTMGNSIEHDDDDDDDDEGGGGGGSKEGIAKNQGGQEGREEDQGQDATTTADADDTDGMMKSKEEEIHQMKLELAELERRRSATAGGGGGGGGGVHKQVATGVPLRDNTQSSTLSAMLEAQQRRRRSSNAWETMSLTSFPMDSPNPFKDVIGSRQDFFTKGIGSVGGMTPIPDGGRQVLGADDIMNNMLNRRDNYSSIHDRMGMLNNMSDVELKKRMMEMVAGASAGGGSGGGGGGAYGMGGGGGGDFGTAAAGNKRKLDDAGSSPSSPNPGPKKSFLQRERIMDAEMRNHMMEALLSGSNANGPRSAGGGGGGGDMNSMMNNRPNSSSSQFMNTPVESSMGVGFNNQDGMLMSQAQAMQQARMMAAKFPSLMSPNEGGGGGGLGMGGGGMMGGNMNMMMGMQNNMNNMGGYPGMSSTGDVNDSSFKMTTKTSSSATKTPKGKTTPSASSKKKGKQKQSSKELVASVLASTGIDKPKRPFSAYNLFFQLEREYIKNEISEGRNPSDDPVIKDAMAHAEKEKEKGKDAKKTDDEKVPLNVENPVDKDELKAHIKKNEQSASRFYVDPLLPERYTQIKLDKYWYSIGHKQKRKHRKTEGGSVGFIELTKMVSARWKRIGKTDPDVKEYCQKLADLELVQYKVEMDAYKKAAKEAEMKIATEEMESRPPVLIQGSAKLTAKKSSSTMKKGSKKKKGKKAADDDNDDRPSTPHDANMNQQGYAGDMSSMSLLNMARFTDLAKFSGLNTPGFLSGLNTPGNNSIMAGFCGDAGQDVGRGLPPPPFGGDGADNNSSGAGNDVANRAGDRARMAAEMNEGHMNNGLMNDEEATMARVRMALQMGNTQMAEQLLKSLQEQNDHNMMQMASNFQTSRGGQSSGSSSQDDALAKLAKADARSRMQMEMLAGGGMSGSNQGGGFGSSMRSMMMNQQQGSFSSGGVGGNDDSRFDVEVDRFLSTLKKKIKDNRSMQLGGAADGGSMGTGNFSQAEQMMMMNMMNRGNSGGSESRAEIMARMMRNMASGNARSGGSDMPEVSPEIMQEMMRRTMAASGGGNTTSPNNTMDNMTMPRPPFGTNDFQRQQGGNQGQGGSSGGGGGGNQWQV